MSKYRILIGDDHALILNGLSDLLLKIDDVALVEVADTKAALLSAMAITHYDIVFLDIHFGKHDGRDIAVEIRQKYPEVVLAALTSFDDKETIQSTTNAGFNAFFLKSDDVNEIAGWIEQGAFDEMYLSAQTQNAYARQLLVNDHKTKQLIHLTEREKQILRLILDEKTSRQIAEIMFLSEKTIENYRASLLHKLDATNIAGLVKKTILLGLLH